MSRRIAIAALVTVWICVGATPVQATIAFVGTFQDWDVRTENTSGGRICAARALHPDLTDGDIFWSFNTALADGQPVGYLAFDPRFLPSGGSITVTIDDEESFVLSQAADGYVYAAQADENALFALMRQGLVMVAQINPFGSSGRTIPVSLLGFTRATDAAQAACSDG